MTARKLQDWKIPPKASAEFVAAMERVLQTYEQPLPLVRETRKPQAATAEHPQRVDSESERAGTAAQSNCARAADATRLGAGAGGPADRPLRGPQKVTLVLDNLNTHTPGAFHATFDPERAQRLVQRRVTEH